MENISTDNPAVLPHGAQAPPAAEVDYTAIMAILPFVLFLALIVWGMRRKSRGRFTVEASYALIAFQLFSLLLLPACHQPQSCFLWAFIPLAMIAILLFFVYQRAAREAQHKERISKALREGHLKQSEVLQGRLEEEIQKSKVGAVKYPTPEEKLRKRLELDKFRAGVVGKPQNPTPPKKEPNPRWIEKMIDD
ncbi:MAG: hypothetical protein ABIN58_13920, partial [candidate division WOR-3 bacterium]